jgi:eukaryotic-like serine/threonine-protein kinase
MHGAAETAPVAENRLDEVIAGYLLALSRGNVPDRKVLLEQNPDLAEELQEFFDDHDWMLQFTGGPDLAEESHPSLGTTIIAGRASGRGRPRSGGTDGDEPRGSFGDYDLLEEIGHGGMGVIYKARQCSLNRLVALKMIRFRHLASPEEVTRFRSEAEMAAGLDHHGIVPIHEVGEVAGQHYYSMALVEGLSLEGLLKQDQVFAPQTAAELVRRSAVAIDFAHARGVVHRDLKPANILLAPAPAATGIRLNVNGSEQFCEPKVTDFGLAKRVESDSGLTGTGQIVGTPSYMSPEQARGDVSDVGPLADVYSLGAVLYCLLTGRAPFRAANVLETLKQVIDDEPVPPRQLNSAIPRDLETICLKCLRKAPADRYSDAAALATDLRRYLADEPIAARPANASERLLKWIRRRPAHASLIVAGVLVLMSLAAAAVGASYSQRLKQSNEDLTVARDLADEHLYFSRVGLAAQNWHANNVATAYELLQRCPEEKRHWEWHYLDRLCHQELLRVEPWEGATAPLTHAHITGDGEWIICAGGGADVWVLESHSGRAVRYWSHGYDGQTCAMAVSPDGRRLIVVTRVQNIMTSAIAYCWDLPGSFEGELQRLPDPIWSAPVSTNNFNPPAAVAPDGRWVAVGSGIHRVVKLDQMAFVTLLPASNPDAAVRLNVDQSVGQNSCLSLAFAPDGETLAIAAQNTGEGRKDGSEDQRVATVEIWRTEPPERMLILSDLKGAIPAVAFSRDGRRLAAAAAQEVVVWETDTYQPVARFPLEHSERILGLAFRPDGLVLSAALADGTIALFYLSTPVDPSLERSATRLRGHTAEVTSLAWFPDGGGIASTSRDGSLRIWDTKQPQTHRVLGTADGAVNGVAFCGNDRWLVTGDSTGEVLRWNADATQEPQRLGRHDRPVWSVAAARGGQLVATGDGDDQSPDRLAIVRIWDVERGVMEREIATVPTISRHLTFSPDGAVLAIGGGDLYAGDGRIMLVEVTTGREIWIKNRGNGIQDLTFNQDGTLLAGLVLDVQPEVFILDAETAGGVGSYKSDRTESSRIETIRFTTDGNRLLYAGNRLLRHDYRSGTIEVLNRPSGLLHGLEHLADSRFVLTNVEMRNVQVWHEDYAQQLLEIPGSDLRLRCIAVSSDRGRIAAGSPDGAIIVWDGRPRNADGTRSVVLPTPPDLRRPGSRGRAH